MISYSHFTPLVRYQNDLAPVLHKAVKSIADTSFNLLTNDFFLQTQTTLNIDGLLR